MVVIVIVIVIVMAAAVVAIAVIVVQVWDCVLINVSSYKCAEGSAVAVAFAATLVYLCELCLRVVLWGRWASGKAAAYAATTTTSAIGNGRNRKRDEDFLRHKTRIGSCKSQWQASNQQPAQ